MDVLESSLSLLKSYLRSFQTRVAELDESDFVRSFELGEGEIPKLFIDQLYQVSGVYKKAYARLFLMQKEKEKKEEEFDAFVLEFNQSYDEFFKISYSMIESILHHDEVKLIDLVEKEDFKFFKKIFDFIDRLSVLDFMKNRFSRIHEEKEVFISCFYSSYSIPKFTFSSSVPSSGLFRSLYFITIRLESKLFSYVQKEKGFLFLFEVQKLLDYASKVCEGCFILDKDDFSFLKSLNNYFREVLYPILDEKEKYFSFYEIVSEKELKKFQDVLFSFQVFCKKYKKLCLDRESFSVNTEELEGLSLVSDYLEDKTVDIKCFKKIKEKEDSLDLESRYTSLVSKINENINVQ